MVSVEKNVELSGKGHADKQAKKEWHRPVLRKLPIAATAADTQTGGNDGNMGKEGHAGGIS